MNEKPTPRKGEVGEKGHEVMHALRHSMREEEQMKRRNANVRMV
jgi:hypothetical protein